MTPRLATPINEAGSISVKKIEGRRAYRARTRFRLLNGKYIELEAEGSSAANAEIALKEKISWQKRAHRVRAVGLSPRSTVLDLVHAWLDFAEADSKTDNPVERRRRPQSYITYRNYTRTTIEPAFKNVKIGEADTPLFQSFLEDLRNTKPGAIKSSRSVLVNAYTWGQRRGVVTDNPVANTSQSFEVVRDASKASRPLTPAEIKVIFKAFDADAKRPQRNQHLSLAYRDILLTMTATGARIGEVLALSPHSYTPAPNRRKRAILTIDSTVVPNAKGSPDGSQRVQRGATKSGRGFRDISVPDFIDAMILRRVEIARSNGSDLLFTTTKGTAISPANFRTRLRRVLDEAGLGGAQISPHSWRKAVAEAIRDGDLGSEGVAQQLGNDPATAEASYLKKRAKVAPDFSEQIGVLNPDQEEPAKPSTKKAQTDADRYSDDTPF